MGDNLTDNHDVRFISNVEDVLSSERRYFKPSFQNLDQLRLSTNIISSAAKRRASNDAKSYNE